MGNCGCSSEWPRGAQEPAKFWLSSLPEEAPLEELARLSKRRCVVERDDLELKEGLPHAWREL